MPSRIAVSALILALSQVAVAQAAAGDRENPAELQVVLDVRLITISDAVFERVGVEFEPVASAETRAKPVHVSTETPAGKQVQEATLGRLFLSADQVRRLMEDAQVVPLDEDDYTV